MAAVLVVARLCEPSSELHIAEDWYRRTALSELLQLNQALVNKDRLYRALDQLLPHKAALEAHLSRRVGELFAVDNEVLLYDVTSTYFEGEAAANAQARRGYSRDHRPDCKQVCIALVVTFDGFPLGYEVFPGNTHDATTVQTIVQTMEARHGTVGKVWIMDRGMASAANLAWLRATGRRYILGTPKSALKQWAPAEYTVEYKGSTFRFVSRANRDAFAADPEKYAPQYGGFCAFGTARGYKASTDPVAFTVVDGKLYLNYNRDVQKQWRADIPGFVAKADKNWPAVSRQSKVIE
jgi:YHS domain-containing protein